MACHSCFRDSFNTFIILIKKGRLAKKKKPCLPQSFCCLSNLQLPLYVELLSLGTSFSLKVIFQIWQISK